jgi:Spy/CpxP family protein refolding chaperone
MNKLKVAIILLLVFAVGALAGSLGNRLYFKHRFERFVKGGRPPLMHILMRKMVHELDLTKAQKTDIEKIVSQAEKQIETFREKYHPEFEKIMDDTIAQIKEKLTDEQKKKLDKLHEELKTRGRMGHRGMPHPPMMGGMPDQLFAAIKERLNLTKEQEEKIRPIIDASREKKQTILKKYGEQEREHIRALKNNMAALDQDTEKQFGSVLTEEQIKEYQKIQEERCPGMRPEMPPEMHHHAPPEFEPGPPPMP